MTIRTAVVVAALNAAQTSPLDINFMQINQFRFIGHYCSELVNHPCQIRLLIFCIRQDH